MISVVMPVYNGERFLPEAVRSVMDQTYRDWELIIVDDGSTDRSREVALEYAAKDDRVSVISQDNAGPAAARNNGVNHARGRWIAFIDADDLWDKDKLKAQTVLMREYPEAVLFYTARRLLRSDGTDMGKVIDTVRRVDYDSLLRGNVITCSSALIRADVAREYPMEFSQYSEDYIMWLRILKKYRCAYSTGTPLVGCRQSEGGKSRNKLRSAAMHWGALKVVGVPVINRLGLFASYALRGLKKYYT